MKMVLMILNALVSSVYGDIVGGQMDSHNCLTGAGYSWCESSGECIRQWITPCEDNYNDCNDCLSRQKNGENISCPVDCDLVTINDPCSLGCPPPLPCPAPPIDGNCEYIPAQSDSCGCSMGCGTINCLENSIPFNCATWYDGCNTCSVVNGQLSSCTYMMCFTNNAPKCETYYRSGH